MVEPDDPRAKDGALYVVFGLLALPLLVVAIGSFVVLPAVSFGLFLKAREQHRAGFLVAAIALAVVWLVYLFWTVRRLSRAKPSGRPGED